MVERNLLDKSKFKMFSHIDRDIDLVDDDHLFEHLERFIDTFINRLDRERWKDLFFKQPLKLQTAHMGSRNQKHLRKVDDLLNWFRPDGILSVEIDHAHSPEVNLNSEYGASLGVCYIPGWPSVSLTYRETQWLAHWHNSNAILSFDPGADVVVFRHEGGTFRCLKKAGWLAPPKF